MKSWLSQHFSYVGSFCNEDGAEGYKYVFNDDIMTIRAEIQKRELAQRRVAVVVKALKLNK